NRLIGRDDVLSGGELDRYERLLGGIVRPLSVEHGQEGVDPGAIARFREEVGVGGRGLLLLPSGYLVVDRSPARERIRDIAESSLDRTLIAGHRGTLPGFRQTNVRVTGAGLEDRVAGVRA